MYEGEIIFPRKLKKHELTLEEAFYDFFDLETEGNKLTFRYRGYAMPADIEAFALVLARLGGQGQVTAVSTEDDQIYEVMKVQNGAVLVYYLDHEGPQQDVVESVTQCLFWPDKIKPGPFPEAVEAWKRFLFEEVKDESEDNPSE